jgi:hypothetical protein
MHGWKSDCGCIQPAVIDLGVILLKLGEAMVHTVPIAV